jgi:hypothetical protein
MIQQKLRAKTVFIVEVLTYGYIKVLIKGLRSHDFLNLLLGGSENYLFLNPDSNVVLK